MSYCRNASQQLLMDDSLSGLTEREKKRLENSWAKEFGDVIFPMINEDKFSVLYSDNPASRPNNPVNVNVGLLILKEIYGQSDEESIDSLMFDIRYQYALHTTSFSEQPISKNSLSNFRRAVYEYNQLHGRDLIQETSYELLWDEVRKDTRNKATIQNTLRRILENYFKLLGNIPLDTLYQNFTGDDKVKCKALCSWINDGSHSAFDEEFYTPLDDAMIQRYLDVFKQIFKETDHLAHYNMMMGIEPETENADGSNHNG